MKAKEFLKEYFEPWTDRNNYLIQGGGRKWIVIAMSQNGDGDTSVRFQNKRTIRIDDMLNSSSEYGSEEWAGDVAEENNITDVELVKAAVVAAEFAQGVEGVLSSFPAFKVKKMPKQKQAIPRRK